MTSQQCGAIVGALLSVQQAALDHSFWSAMLGICAVVLTVIPDKERRNRAR